MNQSDSSYTFDELVVWRTKLPKAEHAVLPPSNNRPNPLATDTMLYVSVFSPGAVYALERRTGKIAWEREIPTFGGSAVCLADGKLFAQTPNTLFALDPETGNTLWSFCPYGDWGESIYSALTLHQNSVFIGDRRGYLHCLDSQTGGTCWKKRTSRAKNDDVNSTPIVLNGLVIIATNARMAIAYEAKTGERAWVSKLDGPSHFGPLVCRGLLAVVTDSIYLLRPETGRIVRRLSWKDDAVSEAESTPRGIIAILRGKESSGANATILGLNEKGVQFTEVSKVFVAFLHYAGETNLIYVSHLEGIDLHRSKDGRLLCRLERRKVPAGNSLVDVRQKSIYALTADGYVYALRHPAIPRLRS